MLSASSQRWIGAAFVVAGFAGLNGQESGLAVSATSLSFRTVTQGVVPDGQVIQVTGAPGTSWTAAVAHDPSSDTPFLVLNGGNGTVTGTTPGTLKVDLRGWLAVSKAAGTYTETAVITPHEGKPVNIAVTWTVLPRAPGPAFRYISGPNGCRKTRDFPDADTCTVPGEWPTPMAPPAIGGSYRDANFGATVRILADPGCSHAYSTPSAVSAANSYVLVWCGGPRVLDAKTGRLVFTPESHNTSARWDARNDSVYYYMNGAAIRKVDVAARRSSTLIDYSHGEHHFSAISSGGTGDTSKDNWLPFWAAKEHQVCVLDIDHLQTYCADYVGMPGLPVSAIDFAMVAKGVDHQTGKRYVLLVCAPSLAVFSVNQAAKRLDFEYRGPESPESKGNHDDICDRGEACLSTPHMDTMEDSSGTQYLVFNGQSAPCEFALATYRINAGAKILIDAELGGGRKRIMAIDKCSGTGPWPKDEHIGCAKSAPYCAISTTYNVVKNPDDKSPMVRTPHLSEVFVMRGNGEEILRLAQLRSLRFTNEGDDGYWTEPRACLSNDASIIIADSNFSQPGLKWRTIAIETGISSAVR